MISFSPLPVTQRCKAWLFYPGSLRPSLISFMQKSLSLSAQKAFCRRRPPAPTTLHTQTCFGRGKRGKEVPYPFHPLPRIKITPSTSPPFSPIACKWRFVRKPFSRIGLAGGKEGNAQSPTYHFNKGKSKSRAFFITAQTPVFPPLSSLLKRIILRLFQFPFFGSSPLAAQIAPNSFFFLLRHSLPPSFSSLSSFLSLSFNLVPSPFAARHRGLIMSF